MQTCRSRTIFESLHLTEVKWKYFPLTFDMTVKFFELFYLGVKELFVKTQLVYLVPLA